MGYPGENRRLSEDTVSTLERHHAFLQQFRADLAGSLKHEKATGWLSRRSKGENSLLSRSLVQSFFNCIRQLFRHKWLCEIGRTANLKCCLADDFAVLAGNEYCRNGNSGMGKLTTQFNPRHAA